jgi:hypothetical protein
MLYKGIRDMTTQIGSRKNELGGMRYTRIHKGQEVPSMRKLSLANRALVNKTAGFKFYFYDRKPYRFDA